MAKKMNRSVIAEGMETQQQLDLLLEQGCDRIQDYLVSRPLTLEAYEQFLLGWKNQPLSSEPRTTAARTEASRSEQSGARAPAQLAHDS